MHTTARFSAATLLLLATTTLGTTTVIAATPTSAPAAAAATGEHAALNPEQQQIQQANALALEGRMAMSYIVAAQQLLSEQHGEEAHQYLEQARDLLTKLKPEVSAGNGNTTGLLSIYSQLGIKEGVEVTDQLKQKLGKTELDAVRGKHDKVVEVLKNTDIELQYSFVDLPVAATLMKVESALKSLSENNIQQASETLADAEADLIHDSIVINAANENPTG
jgi:hypothetical protein